MYYGNRIRILVVDDEPSICAALHMALRGSYDVVTCHSGEDAQTRLMTEHFDALLLDLRMKDLRGDVVFHIAASAQPHLRYSTLFLTGDISEKARYIIEPTGCPILAKPYELSELLRWVHTLTKHAQPASA